MEVDGFNMDILTVDEAMDVLAMLEKSLPETVSKDGERDRLAVLISGLQYTLPKHAEVDRRLLAMAGIPGLSETLVAVCLCAIQTPTPAMADRLAAFMCADNPWPSAVAFNKLSEIGTREAGRLAGEALLRLPKIGRLSPHNPEFIIGLADGLGDKPPARAICDRLIGELASAVGRKGIAGPLPKAFARLARTVALPLMGDLAAVPCRFPGGFWTQKKHREGAWRLYETVLALICCEPDGENLPLLGPLLEIQDPFILEAAIELQLHHGLTPPAALVAKVAGFAKTRYLLYLALLKRDRVSLLPEPERHWLRLAEGRIADYLLMEGDTLFDQFQVVGERTRMEGKKKYLSVAFRCSSSFIPDAGMLVGSVGKILPEAPDPLAESCAHMRSDDTDKSILQALAKI